MSGTQTLKDALEKAQASGDHNELRRTLNAAKEAGVEPDQINSALAELDKLEAAHDPEAAAKNQERTKAENLKKKGNEALKLNTKSGCKDAIDYFAEGIAVRCSDHVLNGQLHSNRAHVHIMLRQYVEAVDDCRKAIEFDKNNMKAYWRAAKASLNLDLCKNGVEFCDAGLEVKADDADLKKLKETCAEKLAAQQLRRDQAAATAAQQPVSLNLSSEDRKVIQEQVESINKISEQIDMLNRTINSKKHELARIQLTLKSLGDVPADTKTYATVGRAFVSQDKSTAEAEMKVEQEQLSEDIPKLQERLITVEKSKEEANKELQEMIKTFSQQSGGGGNGAPSSTPSA